MRNSNTQDLMKILTNGTNLKIAIIDNNIMAFLVRLKDKTDITQLFDVYDLILIPGWVEEEIKDGITRVDCLNQIASKKDIYIIDEKNYSELVNYKDCELIQLFEVAILKMGEASGKVSKYINQFSDREDLDYDDFIDYLYNNILRKEGAEEDRRKKRKNAGEISIVVLSYILGYYYNRIDNITVFTFDNDCYEYVKDAKKILYSKNEIKKYINLFKHKDCKTITFKSSDVIYKDLYDLDNDKGIKIINETRKNSRYLKYTLKKSDGSIEEDIKLLEAAEFIELLKLEYFHLIF